MFKYGALVDRYFRRFILGAFCAMMARQMLTVAIGWEIYERTHSALALGYVGLAQLLPIMLLTLPAGHVADTFDRRKVLIFAQCLNMVALMGLFTVSILQGPPIYIYGFLAILGIGRAFQNPANAAILPEIVDKPLFANAVAMNSIAFQSASIMGPSISGLLIWVFKNAGPVYLFDLICILFFSGILLWGLKNRSRRLILEKREKVSLKSLLTALRSGFCLEDQNYFSRNQSGSVCGLVWWGYCAITGISEI